MAQDRALALCACSARQHVPEEEYVRHLQGFVEHIQETGTKQIILITPPPVDEAARIRENKQVSTLCSCT